MNATEQLAEIRERIARLHVSERRHLELMAANMRDVAGNCEMCRLALALVSAELAAETKA